MDYLQMVRSEIFICQINNNGGISSFDLTKLIRQMVISRLHKENPFSLEKNVKISNVKTECLTNYMVKISCNIGAKYIFTGEIGVDDQMKIVSAFSPRILKYSL